MMGFLSNYDIFLPNIDMFVTEPTILYTLKSGRGFQVQLYLTLNDLKSDLLGSTFHMVIHNTHI